MTSDTIGNGVPGATVSVYGVLENDSDAGVEIEIARLVEDIPSGWATSICTDVLLSR